MTPDEKRAALDRCKSRIEASFRWYRLEGRVPVRITSADAEAAFDQDRQVARTVIGDVIVSTVFLPLCQRLGGDGPPIVFETLVFGGPLDGAQDRYCTWEEAEAGHAAMVARLRVPRCGDHVLHRPTGETWVVAWADGEHLAWAGWPNGRARTRDCDVVRRCSDDEHRAAVRAWADSRDEERREAVLLLYGAALA